MKKTEIFGQYASDRALNPNAVQDPYGTLDARGDGNAAFHTKGLFDEDEPRSTKYDDFTGNGLEITAPEYEYDGQYSDVLPPLIEEHDLAAQFLANPKAFKQ